MSTSCTIYRCGKQDQMYLYVRPDFDIKTLPTELLKRAGTLTEVMKLDLRPERRLARVDVQTVIQRLSNPGWFLQLPPDGHMHGHLHFGD